MENLLKDKILKSILVVVLALLAIFLLAESLLTYRQYQFTGLGVSASNTISVSGKGKVTAKPDLASFRVTVRERAKKQEEAQRKATEKVNKIIAFLKENGVDEKDIKTSSFNLNPRYDWTDGKRVFREYEASQSLTVKIRDLDKAGKLLAAMSRFGAEHVGSLNFEIENPEKLKAAARKKAIENAKAKAKELADALGVELVRVVGFSESSYAERPPVYYAKAMALDGAIEEDMPEPEIPTGENEVTANVTIKFEIR